MKVERVVLTTNNNPTYYQFWNPLSKVYKTKLGIEPTLVFFGTEDEISELGLSNEYGEIFAIKPSSKYHVPWQTTWGLFHFTQLYPNEVCMVIGIDQVPLSNQFIHERIKDISEDSYVMMIAEAYGQHWSTGGTSPSSYHIAKGSTFKKVFGFEDKFEDELDKLATSGIRAFWEDTEGRWGIDESYSCHKLREYRDKGGMIHSHDLFSYMCERRIECERHKETLYNMDLLKAGWYVESHMCRPYSNHKQYLDTIFENIPCYTQQQ